MSELRKQFESKLKPEHIKKLADFIDRVESTLDIIKKMDEPTLGLFEEVLAKGNRYRKALEEIASCKSNFDGDVVSIAKAAMEQKESK